MLYSVVAPAPELPDGAPAGPEIVPRRATPDLLAAVRRVVQARRDPSVAFETDVADMSAAVRKNVGDTALAADIAARASAYAALTAATRLAIRLERVTGLACKYFHVDFVDFRLIVTYAGRGTEYVGDGDADRAALGSGDNRRIVPDRSRVRRVPRFADAYFRGEAAGAGRGVVHRSPPASRRRPRLVLVIDAADPDSGL
jgi:hypothetical protein